VFNIKNATFYREHPDTSQESASELKLYSGLSLSLPAAIAQRPPGSGLAILSTASTARTTLLKILAGQYICLPPGARTYPHLASIQKSPQQAIQYVGFDAERGSSVGGSDMRGSYLSARYESRREETDFSLRDYLIGRTELNALEERPADVDVKQHTLDSVVRQLDLKDLLNMPVSNLSNGQTRRARIAKALMERPEVLLLDGLFMGLDPRTQSMMTAVLGQIDQAESTRVVLSLGPEGVCPKWVNHFLIADEHMKVFAQGTRETVLDKLSIDRQDARRDLRQTWWRAIANDRPATSTLIMMTQDGFQDTAETPPLGEPIIEMRGVQVSYGSKTVLGNWTQTVDGRATEGLWWNLHRGQRYGIFGPNGSGKTTMLSLITSDHPQAYSLPIKIFGRSRLPEPGQPGISLFDLQRCMGHSSPEVHSFFPKQLTVRAALESAWADAPLAKAELFHERDQKVTDFLRWFERELKPGETKVTLLEKLDKTLNTDALSVVQMWKELQYEEDDVAWADELCFGELSFGAQRLLLFLRALIASPDLIILDEALSGVDEKAKQKAFLFLAHGEMVSEVRADVSRLQPSVLARLHHDGFPGLTEDQALVVISHSRADVPGCVKEWICLPEPGTGQAPRMGTLEKPLEMDPKGWATIWGM
jgi:ABC-type molybdenum transport system ATPase subunit/photorepair protein PhrA